MLLSNTFLCYNPRLLSDTKVASWSQSDAKRKAALPKWKSQIQIFLLRHQKLNWKCQKSENHVRTPPTCPWRKEGTISKTVSTTFREEKEWIEDVKIVREKNWGWCLQRFLRAGTMEVFLQEAVSLQLGEPNKEEEEEFRGWVRCRYFYHITWTLREQNIPCHVYLQICVWRWGDLFWPFRAL